MTVVSIQRALVAGALFICTLFAVPASAERVRVTQVFDGDSFRISDGREIRLIGINTPEFGKDGKPNEPLAHEARERLASLIQERDIELEYDRERFDRYRRTLAHASVPGTDSVEETMLSDGLAFQIAQSPNLAHLDRYANAETKARQARRGVWGHTYYVAQDAAGLQPGDTGFRLVRGSVRRVGRGKHLLYIDLAERFTITVSHEDWRHFGGDPQRFIGKRVLARGWVTRHENRLRLRLSHPKMLEVTN